MADGVAPWGRAGAKAPAPVPTEVQGRVHGVHRLRFLASVEETQDRPFRDDVIALVSMLAAAAVFYMAPWAPVYAAALVVLFGLALWRPVLALVLVPAFAPFFMEPKHLGHLRPAPQEVFLGVATLALGVRSFVGPRLRPQWHDLLHSAFLPPAVLFILAAVLSSLVATEHRLAFRAFYQVMLEPVLYFALLTLFVRRDREWWLLLLTLGGTGLFVSCVGLGQLLTGQGLSLVPNTSVQRVKAFYGSPDNLGLLLDRIIPFWLSGLLFAAWRRSWQIAWLLVGIPLLAALGYTFSRGAWIAVGIVLIVFLALRRGPTRWLALLLLVAAGGVAGLKAQSVARVLQAGHANTAQKRIDIWRSALHMLRDHPVLGIGLDNFQHYYAPRPHQQLYSPDCPRGLGYLIESNIEVSKEPCLSHPHDEVLDTWLSTGLLGLAAFAWLQYVFWRSVAVARRVLRPGGLHMAILVGAAGAMLASLLHGTVDNSYFLMDLSVLFWLLCALVQYLARGAPVEGRTT